MPGRGDGVDHAGHADDAELLCAIPALPGAHAATVEGRIRGDHTIDYVLRARAGQHAHRAVHQQRHHHAQPLTSTAGQVLDQVFAHEAGMP